LGHTTAKVTLHSPDTSRSEQIELPVDTASTYMWVSSAVLERLNVEPKTTRKFKTIDGRLLERKVAKS
jgi:predicted aspartyl protease